MYPIHKLFAKMHLSLLFATVMAFAMVLYSVLALTATLTTANHPFTIDSTAKVLDRINPFINNVAAPAEITIFDELAPTTLTLTCIDATQTCAAYICVKDCVDEHYSRADEAGEVGDLLDTYECIQECFTDGDKDTEGQMAIFDQQELKARDDPLSATTSRSAVSTITLTVVPIEATTTTSSTSTDAVVTTPTGQITAAPTTTMQTTTTSTSTGAEGTTTIPAKSAGMERAYFAKGLLLTTVVVAVAQLVF